jgi:AcrR family transcriptional regulator
VRLERRVGRYHRGGCRLARTERRTGDRSGRGAGLTNAQRTRRTGRRPGHSRTREDILAAARHLFGEAGYEGTTIRAVASAADVDPALVVHFFGSKDGLFRAAADWPIDLDEMERRVLGGPLEGIGERLIRFALEEWRDDRLRDRLTLLIRAAASHDEAGAILREFVRRELMGRLALVMPRHEAEYRGTLVMTEIVGLALTRYIVRVEPLASAPDEDVVAAIAPVIQHYLTDPLTIPGGPAQPPPAGPEGR